MSKYGSILHEPWKPGHNDIQIVGRWAEDMTDYVITAPHQLRDEILNMQNDLHVKWLELEAAKKRLCAIEMDYERMFRRG